jgi:hypothetical protein
MVSSVTGTVSAATTMPFTLRNALPQWLREERHKRIPPASFKYEGQARPSVKSQIREPNIIKW